MLRTTPGGLIAVAVAGAAACATARARPAPDLTTTAERTDWVRTGRHAEAVRLCHDFAAAHPDRVRCHQFGTTPEGRALVALAVSADGVVSAEQAAARRRPVVLIQAGIHSGEIEGKDATFWLLRDLLDGKVAAGALAAVTVVFVPILDPDGHERMSPDNRPNQRGPAEMGFRTNAANLNLNRDYLKVDTPELAALLDLFTAWDPVMLIDLHTTDGAKFEHDVAVLVAPDQPGEQPLAAAARDLSSAIQRRLTALGHLPLAFYPSFDGDDDPASGFSTGTPPPRFSQAYAAARNRLGVLVETHSWHRYGERARATYHTVQAILEQAVDQAPAWRRAAEATDAAGAELAGREVVLAWVPDGEARTIEFRGYAYQRVPSEVSGGTWTVYDETRPEVWKVPLRDHLVPGLRVTAPRAGYLVAAGFADVVAARLDHHAISYRRLDRAVTVDGQTFRVTAASYAPPFEGRTRPTLTGDWQRERRELAPGALWVPIDQPRAFLVLHLFEPSAPDSLAAWGFFNATLERKEYMESYLAEEVARAMLADPAVKAAFDEALRDPEFAASPRRRLDFFYRRHPSWDERWGLLPVMRAERAP